MFGSRTRIWNDLHSSNQIWQKKLICSFLAYQILYQHLHVQEIHNLSFLIVRRWCDLQPFRYLTWLWNIVHVLMIHQYVIFKIVVFHWYSMLNRHVGTFASPKLPPKNSPEYLGLSDQSTPFLEVSCGAWSEWIMIGSWGYSSHETCSTHVPYVVVHDQGHTMGYSRFVMFYALAMGHERSKTVYTVRGMVINHGIYNLKATQKQNWMGTHFNWRLILGISIILWGSQVCN